MSNRQTSFSSFRDVVNWHSEHSPDQLAYTFLDYSGNESETFTFGEMSRAAKRIGSQIRRFSGQRILLLLENGSEFVQAFFGCLVSGCVAVPAKPPNRNRSFASIQHVIDDSGSSVAITDKKILARLSDTNGFDCQHVFCIEDLLGFDHPDSNNGKRLALNGDDLAFLQYTSGSTGRPKGVKVSHGNLISNQEMIQAAFRHHSKSVVVGWLPLHHDMGLIGNVLQPFFIGAHCILMSPATFMVRPVRWLKAITKYRATTGGGPNFAYDLCVEKTKPEDLEHLDLRSWRIAYNGSETISRRTLHRFANYFRAAGFDIGAFYPCYGLAEATLFVCGRNFAAETSVDELDSAAPVSCGQSQKGLKVTAVDPLTGEPCPNGVEGEIWVSGPSVAGGYWNGHAEEKFLGQLPVGDKGPYLRTGDLGVVDDTGDLFVTGRIDDLMIIRGRNIHPEDVEQTVRECHLAFRNKSGAAFTVPAENANGAVRLILIQEVDRRTIEVPRDELIECVREAVTGDHGLKLGEIHFVNRGSLPKTTSGKIQRKRCKREFILGTLNKVEFPEEEVAGDRS